MNKITLRQASLKDAVKIAGIIKELDSMHMEALGNTFRGRQSLYPLAEAMLYILRPKYKVILAYFEKEAVGAAICRIGTTEALILKVFVSYRFRQMGICRAMISYLCDVAEEKGCRRVTIDAFSFNKEACKAYEHNGFREYHRSYEYIL